MSARAGTRARDLGVVIGEGRPGPINAITDVPGVLVGQVTVRDEPRLHTGVTAVVPSQLGPGRATIPCGLFVGNGHGKLVGVTQVVELGTLETPVLLTSTLSAFRVADALVGWVLRQPGHERTRTINPVVGETNDGLLSDIRARPITSAHVEAALDGANGGRVEEGCVGAGTGTTALGYKAGIGTSSRLLPDGVVGVLVQTNFSGTLRVNGTSVPPPAPPIDTVGAQGNSCMIVVATDAPLDARQLTRVCRRAVFAMGRTGADFTSGSGDYAIAFSVAEPDAPRFDEAGIDPVFAAVMEATEEAIVNSLTSASTTVGLHRTVAALSPEHLRASLGL